MNHVYRLVWNPTLQALVAVCESARGRGKSGGKAASTPALVAIVLIAACAMPAGAISLNTLPTGGQVSAGAAAISSTANTLTVNQSSQRAAINWQSFSVGSAATVNFVQPNASSVILNRVVGNEQSVIAGAMNANGQVFLLNSNGVLFTGTSSVNAGGLVASTLNMSDADFMAGRNTFTTSANKASVINLGTITAADGGYVALLGNQVKNEGVITARLGTAIMAAGDQISLNFNGDSLVGVTIDQGTLNALVENKQAIHADGGLVVLTAKGLDAVMATVVNNTGEIRARTVANKEGKIYLLGGMDNNRIEVGGTLDASAPNGGDGGFVEASAANVQIKDDVRVTTLAPQGRIGTWLIDPTDFTIAAGSGGQTSSSIGASTLSTNLGTTNVTLQTDNINGTDAGDINVNAAVSWNANTTLTLDAYRNININADITATGTTGKLALYYGQGLAASGNTATFNLRGGHVNLKAGQNFDTKLGNDGAVTNWTVITDLGTEDDAYATPATMTLQGINASHTDLGGNYVLGTNIDASGTSSWYGGAGFVPIGEGYTTTGGAAVSQVAGTYFYGQFNGLGHTVDSLYINDSNLTAAGLFGVTWPAKISNVGVTNANITAYYNVGALVGVASTGTTISNSYSSGSVASDYRRAGGLVGMLYGAASTISNSYSTASASAADRYAGGLVGHLSTSANISYSYASGAVSATAPYKGGLVGGNFNSSVTNSYWDTDTSGQSTGILGTGIANANAYAQASYTGFDFTSTGAWFSVAGSTRPFLKMEATTTIANAHELQLMSMNSVNSYTVANNIDMAPSLTNKSEMWKDNSASVTPGTHKGSFVPVVAPWDQPFTGNFNGAGNAIDSLYIDTTSYYAGLFGYVSGSALISNVGLTNVNITTRNYTSPPFVGALVGKSTATIRNSYSTGTVSAQTTPSFSVASVGGLAGYNGGTIETSHTSAVVSYSGTTRGSLGGLAGYNRGTIQTSYASGAVNGGTASNSSLGGLVGYNNMTIQTSYASGAVNGGLRAPRSLADS